MWFPLCTGPPSVPLAFHFVKKNLLTFPSSWLFLPAAIILALSPLGCFNADQLGGEVGDALVLEAANWGRLVDVVDQDGMPMESKVVINPELVSDGVSYLLSTNPVTQDEVLTILQPAGSPSATLLLSQAKADLPSFSTKGYKYPPPYEMVARNAALVFEFSEPLDPNTVTKESLQITAGNPPVAAITGLYYVSNDLERGVGSVIFDPTISSRQSAELGLPQNATGFPAALDAVDYSLQVDLPTVLAPEIGQPVVIKSLNGLRKITASSLGSLRTLASGPAVNLVARAGGDMDESHGFMRDNTPPNLVGRFDAVFDSVISSTGPTAIAQFHIVELNCQGIDAKRGDVFEVGSVLAVVNQTPEPKGGNVWEVALNVLTYDELTGLGGLVGGSANVDARLTTVYRAQDSAYQACFLDIQPPPLGGFPSTSIDPNSTVTIRFDEAIDPLTVLSMHSFVVTSVEDPSNVDFFGPVGATPPGARLTYDEDLNPVNTLVSVSNESLNGGGTQQPYVARLTDGGVTFSANVLPGSLQGVLIANALTPPEVYFVDDGTGGIVEVGGGSRIDASTSTISYSSPQEIRITLSGGLAVSSDAVVSFDYSEGVTDQDPFEGVCAYPPLPGLFRSSLKAVGSTQKHSVVDEPINASVGYVRGFSEDTAPANVAVNGGVLTADVTAENDIIFESVRGSVTTTVLGTDKELLFAYDPATQELLGDGIGAGSQLTGSGTTYSLTLSVTEGVIVDSSVLIDFRYEFSDGADESFVDYRNGALSLYMPNFKDVDDASVVADYQYAQTETSADYIDRLPGYDLAVIRNNTQDRSEFAGRVYFGPIEVGDGSREFTLSPVQGFSETNTDDYLNFLVALRDGQDGIQDLAGNGLGFAQFFAGSTIPITVAGGGGVTAASHDSYFCLRVANGLDDNNDGQPEFAGQVTWGAGAMSGRAPERFSRSADSGNEYVGAKIALGLGLPEPLVPSGSVLMTVHRPQDFGFSYNFPLEFNLDIDGASWAPFGAKLYDDFYQDISVSFAHANVLPDEVLNPQNNLPIFPGSGLSTATFNENVLGQPELPETEVFRSGYTMRGVNMFAVPSGAMFIPWPTFNESFTWRDTGINPLITGGALDSLGSPPANAIQPGDDPNYGPGMVPATDLGLLTRFRCYPQQLAHSLPLNTFQATDMVNLSALPAWRIFSSGGRDAGGKWREVIPDNTEAGGTIPSGGFDAAGLKTAQMDTYLYWMNIDFAVRVSRVYSHWVDTGSAIPTGGIKAVMIEPSLSLLPVGTDIQVDYRGAAQVGHPNSATAPGPLTSAATPFDAWGNLAPNAKGSVSSPSEWSTNVHEIEGQQYRYFQVRLTIVSDPDAGVAPNLDAVGIVWGGA